MALLAGLVRSVSTARTIVRLSFIQSGSGKSDVFFPTTFAEGKKISME